ncbi:unnamed protein product, partial [Prorocentrum cordatum]
ANIGRGIFLTLLELSYCGQSLLQSDAEKAFTLCRRAPSPDSSEEEAWDLVGKGEEEPLEQAEGDQLKFFSSADNQVRPSDKFLQRAEGEFLGCGKTDPRPNPGEKSGPCEGPEDPAVVGDGDALKPSGQRKIIDTIDGTLEGELVALGGEQFFKTKVKDLDAGDLMMLHGVPIKIRRMDCTKREANFAGQDIFNGMDFEDKLAPSPGVDCPHTRYKDDQLIDIKMDNPKAMVISTKGEPKEFQLEPELKPVHEAIVRQHLGGAGRSRTVGTLNEGIDAVQAAEKKEELLDQRRQQGEKLQEAGLLDGTILEQSVGELQGA